MEKKYKEKIDKFADRMLDWSEEKRIEFIEKLLSVCKHGHEKYVVVMLYIYGLRPAELMQITIDKFTIGEDELRVRLPTLKGGIPRTIDLSIKDTPFISFLVNYLNQNVNLLPRTWHHTTNINAVFKKIAKKLESERISPYIFREFRLSYLAIVLDASATDLQTWKGAKDFRSVSPYIRRKPIKKFSKLIR